MVTTVALLLICDSFTLSLRLLFNYCLIFLSISQHQSIAVVAMHHVNQSVKQANYFIVHPKVDQRAAWPK